MVKLSSLRLDEKAETEGVWREFAPGLSFKIARAGCAPYRAAVGKIMAPFVTRRGASKLPEGPELKALIVPAVARHLVRDWKGLEAEDGAIIAYSPEKAEEILRDDAHDDLYLWVMSEAGDTEQYRESVLKELRGN